MISKTENRYRTITEIETKIKIQKNNITITRNFNKT